MAGERVNNHSIGDVNLSSLMTCTDAQRIGFHAVSLTEYGTTSEPEIAAGSKIEVNGTLYKFDTDEEITGSPSDGDVYIKLIPSGSSITAEWENDAPTWDDEKQGWYESGTNNRYLNFKIYLDTGSYTKFSIGVSRDIDIFRYDITGIKIKTKIVEIGDWNMDQFSSKDVAHGLSNFKNIRSVNVIIRNDDDDEYHRLPTGEGSTIWGQIDTINTTNISMTRAGGVKFDHVDYDSTSFNRGWIIIDYIE